MKKIIISFGIAFMLLGLSLPGFAHCTIHIYWEGDCAEKWCFNAGSNTPVSCPCGTPVDINCGGGPQQ